MTSQFSMMQPPFAVVDSWPIITAVLLLLIQGIITVHHLSNDHRFRTAWKLALSQQPSVDPLEEAEIFNARLLSYTRKSRSGIMFLTFDTPLNFCDICDEDKIWFTVFAAPCGHRFCSDCPTTLFGLCTTDEEVYPPRCCTQTIPLDRVNGGLSRELVETFRAKSIEWETKDRTYCYNTKCAKFIPPEGIVGNTATCQQCYRRTGPSCKTAAHTGNCPRDTAMEQLLEVAEREHWQRCYSCTRLVVLAHGCNHISYVSLHFSRLVAFTDIYSCPCGAEFCYVCGSRWLPRSCECGVWNEHNLTGRPRPADLPPDRRRRLLRIRYTVLDHVSPLPQMLARETRLRFEEKRRNPTRFRQGIHQDILRPIMRFTLTAG